MGVGARDAVARVGAAASAEPPRLAAAAFGGSAVWYIVPWRGLILPPPGGVPYLAMISGWPRSSVVIVVGTLSSSTQTYSGSLATSPKRGFLMRSQRVSADLMTTEGSPGSRMPRIFFVMAQPVRATAGRSSQTRYRIFMRRGA